MMMTSGVPTLHMPSNEKERGERNERSALHNNNTGEFVAITFLTKKFELSEAVLHRHSSGITSNGQLYARVNLSEKDGFVLLLFFYGTMIPRLSSESSSPLLSRVPTSSSSAIEIW